MKILRCPELSDGQAKIFVDLSLMLTIFQITTTVIVTFIESKWLQESTLSYLMTKMTANTNWIPFIHLITKRRCHLNINYGDLSIVMPIFSHLFGYQTMTYYQFSDKTLMYLLNELKLWSSEVRGQVQEQRFRIILTKDCLDQVSLNTLVHFVANFPQEIFILELQLNWDEFYENKQKRGLIKFTLEQGQKRIYSPTGVPLLQLCIQNEQMTQNGDWMLKDMLKKILNSGHYALHDVRHGSPLTVALQYNCFESIDIMMHGDGGYHFDFQMPDNNNQSFLGYLTRKLQDFTEESGPEFDKINDFSNAVYDRIAHIDLHKKQFQNTGTVKKKISAWQLIFKNLRHHRQIKQATQKLLDKAFAQGDFTLNEGEKMTLFKNTIKLMMSHSRGIEPAWQMMGELCRKCGVNVFEMRDQRRQGIEHRLVKSWPIQIIKCNEFQTILHNIGTQQMRQNRVNYVQLIFRKIIEADLVKSILQKSIFTVKQILHVDSQNTTEINNIDNDAASKEQLVHLVSKAALTNVRCAQELFPLVTQRMRNTPNFKQLVKKYINEQKQQMDAQRNDIQENNDRAVFEGNKLTQIKKRTSEFKRKVSNDYVVQEDPQLFELSKEQKQRMGMLDTSREVTRRKNYGSMLRTSLETLLEWIAAADLYTDILVFRQLLQTDYHGWTTVTIFSLLAPFLACQTPFLMFLKEQIYRDKQERLKLRLMGNIMVSPFMLIYMFLLDVIFVFNQAFLFPLISLIRAFTCGCFDFTCLYLALEKSYEYLFEMNKLEVAGFRRMRTISQLTFESMIQIVLQIQMLLYFREMKDQNSEYEFGVSITAILVSLMLAAAHALLEILFLYMEAQASKTSFLNYCIVCFNGRFGWVPYNDFLIKQSNQLTGNGSDEVGIQENEKLVNELNYQNIQSRLLCFDMQVEFIFTDDTIMALTKTLASFPQIQNEKDMPKIRFGFTVNQVSLENLENLLRVCKNKLVINLEGTDLYSIFYKSKYANLLSQRDASALSQDDNNYIFNLQKSKLNQLLSFVLKQNQENLKATTEIEGTQMTLGEIALQQRDAQLLELLLSLDSDVFKSQMKQIICRNSLTLRYINTIDFDIWITLASNSTIFNPHQESLIFQAFMDMQTVDPALFRRSKKFWHARFGPSMPQEIINDVMRFSIAHDFMSQYKDMYPKKIYVASNGQYVDVDCKTAFCFAAIRKKLIKAWEISDEGPSIDNDTSEGTYNNPLDISDLDVPLADFKLLNMILSDEQHNTIKNLKQNKVNELDKHTFKLKMDTYRWLYVGRTRLGDESGSQIECIFHGRDRKAPETDNNRYEIEAGFNKKFDVESDDQHSYYDSLQIDFPRNMTFLTSHKTYHQRPPVNTSMSTFILQEDTAFRGFLFNYQEQQNCIEQGDATILAQPPVHERIEKITSAKPIYQIDSIRPGASVRYCAQSLWQNTTLQSLRVTVSIDFEPGTDLEAMQRKLEEQAQASKIDYIESVNAYHDDNKDLFKGEEFEEFNPN